MYFYSLHNLNEYIFYKIKNKTMWVKKQVIMLPTNEKAKMWLNKFSNQLHIDTVEKENHENAINQHLYFLSSEEIKEGDWFIRNNKIHQCFKSHETDIEFKTNKDSVYCGTNTFWNKKYCKKIISATDSSLFKEVSATGYTEDRARTFYGKEYLPKPSQEFLKIFAEEYNKGNVITEVMVEYEEVIGEKPFREQLGYKLKVNSKNEITIKMKKDSYSREEVIDILKKYNDKYSTLFFDTDKKDVLNKWVSENL